MDLRDRPFFQAGEPQTGDGRPAILSALQRQESAAAVVEEEADLRIFLGGAGKRGEGVGQGALVRGGMQAQQAGGSGGDTAVTPVAQTGA